MIHREPDEAIEKIHRRVAEILCARARQRSRLSAESTVDELIEVYLSDDAPGRAS